MGLMTGLEVECLYSGWFDRASFCAGCNFGFQKYMVYDENISVILVRCQYYEYLEVYKWRQGRISLR
jgi:hypothetical protein